jgi:hypothetical protein
MPEMLIALAFAVLTLVGLYRAGSVRKADLRTNVTMPAHADPHSSGCVG